jgi:hypothetical protein
MATKSAENLMKLSDLNEEQVARLEQVLDEHHAGTKTQALDCIAHSEGQYCCVDGVFDIEAWNKYTFSKRYDL